MALSNGPGTLEHNRTLQTRQTGNEPIKSEHMLRLALATSHKKKLVSMTGAAKLERGRGTAQQVRTVVLFVQVGLLGILCESMAFAFLSTLLIMWMSLYQNIGKKGRFEGQIF